MGGETCESCRSWADDIYWNHFQFVHFAQFLRSGYEQHLALPRRFSDNLKKKLPGNVALRGPGGPMWNIGLTTRDDTLYFTHGWQQFLKDHSLRENDFLVFKYNGESQFDVLIFDGESFCEKAASYFVRKCGHTEHENGRSNSKKKDTNALEEVGTPSNAAVGCATPEKSVHGNSIRVAAAAPSQAPSNKTSNAGVECASPEQFINVDSVTVPAAVPFKTPSRMTSNADVECASLGQFIDADVVTVPAAVPSQTPSEMVTKLLSPVQHIQTKRRGRPPKASNSLNEVVNWVPADSEPASVSRSGTPQTLYISNRRPVTENEISNALQLGQAAFTSDSFSIVMQPTHVYKGFYMTIPSKWATEHLSPRSQDVILRMGKSEWHAKYTFDQIRYIGGLSGGWKHFALDNYLEEFDVCVFKPTGQINNILALDVSIFRVVQEVAPLSLVNPPAGKRGRRKLIKDILT